jgi:hypothetical protein
VNGSYIPSSAKSALNSDLNLIWEGSVMAGSDQRIVLPVKVKNDIQCGAISLGFYYPEEYLELENVTLGNGNGGLVWSTELGLVKLGWSSLTPYILKPEQVIVNLHFRTRNLSELAAPIALQLYQDVELADGFAKVLNGVTLSIPLVESLLTGTQELQVATPEISVYPNPTPGDALISMLLPDQGNYEIEVFDVMGKLVESVSNEYNNSGKCMVRLGCGKYPAGVYMAKFRINCGAGEFQLSKKVVVQR